MANHRSLRDEQELLLMPQHQGDRAALAIAAIYGANAAGKSTVIDALSFLQTAVRDSYQRWTPNGPIPREPFRLDAHRRFESSWYVIEVLIDGARWTYGFEVDDRSVIEEWLYAYPQNRRRVIFERDANGIRLGSTVANRRDRSRVLKGLTRDNALFLSLAAQVGIGEVLPVFSWLDHSLRVVRPGEASSSDLADYLIANPDLQEAVKRLIAVADLGVTDVKVEAGTPDRLEAAQHRIVAARARVERSLDGRGDNVEAVAELESALRDYQDAAVSGSRNRIMLAHGTERQPFELRDESAGTRSWMALLPLVLEALSKGETLVVDELDTSLHPRLLARIIELFRSPETNDGGGQLLFTTHDATLLGTSLGVDLLRRDEIWFVEKQEDGATTLFPLSDFRPRKGENTERRYLGGSYGAVPTVFSDTFVDQLAKLREHGRAAS